jgi:hypothetical protein
MPPRDREAYNTYMRDYMLRRYHRRRREALTQLGGLCVICGETDEDQLRFDHVDAKTKSFDLAKRLAGVSEKKLQEELRKCQVLCDDCHKVKSWEAGDIGNKGSQNGSAKLTEEKVLEARRRWRPRCPKNGAAALARENGVSTLTMTMALKRKTWKHV